ncbi:LysR family transcriptional regulator [Rubritalea tangerina]|uniref:LysR family transcriptional regulator n=2 Tax=Rubritalea tangerina TaxID=430798 RepID=A0ABW4ZEG5_9BACT
MSMHLTTTQLQALDALSELRHFTKAAQRLGITQSALSQQVKALEQAVGLPLINRDTRPLTMTPMGEKLLVRARLILQQASAIEAECRETESLKEGKLSFGIIPTIAPYLTRQILPHFITSYPGIQLDIHEDTTSNLAKKVHQGHIDLAITSDLDTLPANTASHLDQHPLFKEKLYLATPTDPHSPDRELPMIGLKEGHCLRDQAVAICNQAIDQNISCDQIATLISLVKAGLGSAVIPSMAVPQPADPAIQVNELPNAQRLIQVITRPQVHPNPATSAFIDTLTTQLPQVKHST